MDFLDVKDEEKLQNLAKHYENGVNVFVLIYMNGCGPCEKTKPEWLKLKDKKWENSIVAQIDKDILPETGGVFNTGKVSGFPTIRHYSKNGEKDYNMPERTAELFEKWIDTQLEKTDRTLPNSVYMGHFIPRSKRKRSISKKSIKRPRRKRRRTR